MILLRLRTARPDQQNGQTAFNTGGEWINSGLGIQLQPSDWVRLQTSILMPLYRNLQGTQLTSSLRFRVGAIFQFPGIKTIQKKGIPELPSLSE